MAGDEWRDLLDKYALVDNDRVLALDKPVGISVMGERHDTDLARIAAAAGDKLHPVHRIDKVTSGVVLFARDLDSHGRLTRQFNKRTVDKTYLATVTGTGLPDRGHIDLPLSVGRKNRVRVAAPREDITVTDGHWSVPDASVFTHVKVYPSVTEFETLYSDGERTLLAVRPISGRRHQIRVHLAWIGFAIVGDVLYDKKTDSRTLLHSWRLCVDAPWRNDERTVLEAPPGDDFWKPLPKLDVAAVLAPARLPHGVPEPF